MTDLVGTLFDIRRNSFVDGPGIRTAVFFKGCNLRCAWCHNPESQRAERELLIYPRKCRQCGKCRNTAADNESFLCPNGARELCGKSYAPEEVLAEIRKDQRFYDASGGGVTFSGGECMLQVEFLSALLKGCRELGIHTAVDTAGDVPYERFAAILPDTDLFLYDLKMMDPEKHRHFTGRSNARILDNLKNLFAAGASVWVRIPVIEGINDTEEEIGSIRDFLTRWGPAEKAELLPYHAMGDSKYDALSRKRPSFRAPSPEKLTLLSTKIGDSHASVSTGSE